MLWGFRSSGLCWVAGLLIPVVLKVVHFFKTSQISYYTIQCTAFMYQGLGVFQIQSFKAWGINNHAAQCSSAENMSPQCLCHCNLKSPTCIVFAEPFLNCWFDLGECRWTVQVCLFLVILLPSVTLKLHVSFQSLLFLWCKLFLSCKSLSVIVLAYTTSRSQKDLWYLILQMLHLLWLGWQEV
jgi:hypothetical protein